MNNVVGQSGHLEESFGGSIWKYIEMFFGRLHLWSAMQNKLFLYQIEIHTDKEEQWSHRKTFGIIHLIVGHVKPLLGQGSHRNLTSQVHVFGFKDHCKDI